MFPRGPSRMAVCVFWPWVRVQRQGTVGRRAGGGDGPDTARSLRLLTIIHIEPAYCQDPSLCLSPSLSLSLSLPLSLSLSLPFNLTVSLFLVLSKYPPFYFHLHRCFFHVSAFILSISFHLYNSLPLYPLLHFIFLSLCLPLSLEVQMDTFAG